MLAANQVVSYSKAPHLYPLLFLRSRKVRTYAISLEKSICNCYTNNYNDTIPIASIFRVCVCGKPLIGISSYLPYFLDYHNAFLAESSWANRLFRVEIQQGEDNKMPGKKSKQKIVSQ